MEKVITKAALQSYIEKNLDAIRLKPEGSYTITEEMMVITASSLGVEFGLFTQEERDAFVQASKNEKRVRVVSGKYEGKEGVLTGQRNASKAEVMLHGDYERRKLSWNVVEVLTP